FRDVAALIDPTTVTFKSITHPTDTTVLEQNYYFDLVNQQKLLERFLDQTITAEQYRGEQVESFEGKLLSAAGGLVLENNNGRVTALNHYDNIRFPELPGGLITKPTLVWDVATESPGKHTIESSYQTDGITWWADYNAVYSEGKNENSGFLDLGAWVSIVNKSGASYNDAKLKLIAGDVHRATPARPPVMRKEMMMAMAADSSGSGFQEKSFFEFHLYTLGRAATIPDNSTKQIELFPQATGIPVTKEYLYDGAQQPDKVGVYLKFRNEKEQGLGIALPAGRLRVSKRDDADNSLEFIGEDIIDHTPKDEDIRVKLGNAFDIVGERKQTYNRTENARRWAEEKYEIVVRNHKDAPIDVTIKEHLYRSSNWKISDYTGSYEKQDSNTIHFPVHVPANGEETVQYTVRYTW
ncbi:MAG: DUF4139 domain-containing protein, partial [Rickettsiales bacterium]|nr:DUF4139 domain-containing protein [Rickettsiales bacterium]